MSWSPHDAPVAPAQTAAARVVLLAVDLGLSLGLAGFDASGRIVLCRGHHLASRGALGRFAAGLVRTFPALEAVVVEGGPDLARPWRAAADVCGATYRRVDAPDWRRHVLLARERTHGPQAKQAAQNLAAALWAADAAGRGPPDHNAAEAALIGAWAVADAGTRRDPWPGVLHTRLGAL